MHLTFKLNYFSRHYDPKRGFLYLALLYSLPYVLLMWSLLLAALATLVSGINSGVGMSVGILGVILGFAIILTILRWNMEGSVYDAISGQWRTTYEQWKKKYLRLLGDAVRGQDPSDTNPLTRQGIAAAADSETPGETETHTLPPT